MYTARDRMCISFAPNADRVALCAVAVAAAAASCAREAAIMRLSYASDWSVASKEQVPMRRGEAPLLCPGTRRTRNEVNQGTMFTFFWSITYSRRAGALGLQKASTCEGTSIKSFGSVSAWNFAPWHQLPRPLDYGPTDSSVNCYAYLRPLTEVLLLTVASQM